MATFENLTKALTDIREALEKLGLKLRNVPLMEWPKAILSLDEPIEACNEETKLYIRGIGSNPFWKEEEISSIQARGYDLILKK